MGRTNNARFDLNGYREEWNDDDAVRHAGKKSHQPMTVILLLVGCEAMGCQRDNPAQNVETPTDKAAVAIERAINTPLEKAKAVDGTLQRAADRTAEQTQKAGE